MAGRKLSANVEEEVVFMEQLMLECQTITRRIEEYAASKKNQDAASAQITRGLSQMRQRAMQKGLGPLADAAGTLGILCSRGSQTQRARTMREGIINFKILIERMMKATIDADGRKRAEAERLLAADKAAEGSH